MTDTRYLQPGYSARYIEAEWGDFLLKHARFPEGRGTPFDFGARNIPFYTGVVEFLRENLRKMPDFRLERVADIGCASGRLVREICEGFESVTDVRGYEPSPKLCALARQMVLGEPLSPQLLINHLPLDGFLRLDVTPELRDALRSEAAQRKARFFEATAETAPITHEYFDIVCCLNVIDRHPDPRALMTTLRYLIRKDGLLCVGSPLDWQESGTAVELREDTVTAYLDAATWRIIDQRDIEYQFRTNSRRILHYSSQVVLAQRLR